MSQALPESDLIRLLTNYADRRRHAVSFDFLARLKDFHSRVSAEVRQINVLFPEYTPHDEEYHLRRLFSVADTILGVERLNEFNASELFVLAAALYGHDWGMAVSESERQFILTGHVPKDFREEGLWILPDERARLKRFAKEQRISLDEKGCTDDMPIEDWREYVRQTHAFRSGERVRRYFRPYDGGVAEAVARACEGHWLDFERLQDFHDYPTDFAVLGEAVNLRALAVYVRLIDLLDLAEDRTPYVIWKFVAPRSSRSRMEWAKHRALQPVTPVSYQEGRILRVDGSTDSHEVYAALEDLKRWVDEQFRGCNDLLARMNDSRHRLDLYRIDWRLSARGFKPVSIQFEFDRSRMFEILSEEIYQGDPYVFLRELLQNSIDAIRMRREILARKGVAMAEPPVISVDVEHGKGGDALITWRDEGIGMDEYIVRNYLAVAGKSYYRSEDFEKEQLRMDPIARFGVGILSCFMVADTIAIETCREPHMQTMGKPLRVVIPRVDKQFRIEIVTEDEISIGTTIRVHVAGRKLPLDEEGKPIALNVTEYIRSIAGFVEFPILVDEDGQKALILHPTQESSSIRGLAGNVQIHKLDLAYPWHTVIHFHDLSVAERLLHEEKCDLAKDLQLASCEGILSYLVPTSIHFDTTANQDLTFTQIVVGPDESGHQDSIRMKDQRFSRWGEQLGISLSSRSLERLSLYKDGILVSEAELSDFHPYYYHQEISRPCLRINIRNSTNVKLNLARARMAESDGATGERIGEAFLAFLFNSEAPRLQALDLVDRFARLGWLSSSFGIDPDELIEHLPAELIVIPVFRTGVGIVFVEAAEIAPEKLLDMPLGIERIFSKHADMRTIGAMFKKWRGGDFILNNRDLSLSSSLDQALSVSRSFIAKSHKPTEADFLTSQIDDYPVAQINLSPATTRPIDQDTLLERVIARGFEDLDPVEKSTALRLGELPLFCNFSEPLQHAFSYQWIIFNANHPTAINLLRVAAFTKLLDSRKTPDRDLEFLTTDCRAIMREGLWSTPLDSFNAKLETLVRRARALGLSLEGGLSVKPEEIIPRSREKRKDRRFGEPFKLGRLDPETP